MEKQSWICSNCDANGATFFCLCRGGDSLLCEKCFPVHLSKNLHTNHSAHPIAAYPFRSLPGYFAHLQERSDYLPTACEDLRRNVLRVDSCIRELNEKVEALVESLRLLARTETERLETVKQELLSDIEASIEEAERTLYEEAPRLESKYAHLLRRKKDCSLLSYEVRTDKFDPRSVVHLSFDLAFSVLKANYQSTGTVLPQISKDRLQLQNLQTGTTNSINLNLSFSAGTTFCLLDDEQVLAVGEDPASVHAYELSLMTGEATEVQAMSVARDSPGLARHESCAYVFGGWNSSSGLTSCEKFRVPSKAWSPLPHMKYPRCVFTPVLLGTDIYLPEVWKSGGVLEVFSTLTEQFKALQVVLPSELGSGCASVAFFCEDELIVVTDRKKLGKCRLNAETTFCVSAIRMENSSNAHSNILPMEYGRTVFWANYSTGALVKFELDSQTIVEASP